MLCEESWCSDKFSVGFFGRTEAHRCVNAIHVDIEISLEEALDIFNAEVCKVATFEVAILHYAMVDLV